MVTIFSGGILGLIRQSDATTLCILCILLFISITCWSLFLYNLLYMREQRYHMVQFIRKLNASNDISLLMNLGAHTYGTVARYQKQIKDLIISLSSPRVIDARSWELFQQQLLQRAEQILAQQESTSTVLSTSATIAPLLGLLGTVWGLVHAFMNIATTQSADITAVAPGIAEALITTIAGLFVAIPALIMYNITTHLHTGIREYMYELVDAVALLVHKTHHQGSL